MSLSLRTTALAVVVHLLFLFAAFDIHFVSPVVKDVESCPWKSSKTAKRLVLVIADGLRFDTFWKTHGLYLHNVSTTNGIWGKSRTRVPTESRTGHVAIIAGLYEDPSAVFKGWKENPVDFDSVFNQSRYTWSWGSPDILRIFAKGFNSDHVFASSYSPDDEDFTGTDSYKLDEWVFHRFEDFLKSAARNKSLGGMLQQDGVVMFLHLLGLDTNGHSKKPHSREYEENLRYVDEKVKAVEKAVNKFFGDDATAFLFTSDHGMTDWGSHGAGDPSETDTPFVAWGAGVYKPPFPATSLHSVRRDCNQGDLTPLMASLLGINFPVNSMGFLHVEHLIDDTKYRAEAMLANANQMYQQFLTLEERKKSRTFSFTFQPYSPLVDSKFAVKDIQTLIDKGFFSDAIQAAEELHQICDAGINYYHRYDRPWLYCVATLGFIGWMAYVCWQIIEGGVEIRAKKEIVFYFAVIGVVIAVYLLVEGAPFQYIIYAAVPVSTWSYVISRIPNRSSLSSIKVTAPTIFAVIFGCNLLVLSFFHRWCLSFLALGAAATPHLVGLRNKFYKKAFWSVTCLLLALMPLFPVVGQHRRLRLVYTGGIVVLILSIAAFIQLLKRSMVNRRTKYILVTQLGLIGLSCLVKWSSFSSVESGQGLPVLNQIFSWAMLGQSLLTPLLVDVALWTRLFSVFLGLLPSFILLSLSHEVLFYASFSLVLFAWLLLDGNLDSKGLSSISEEKCSVVLRNDDIRISFLYLYFTVLSFFGLGNVASVNSFDPSASFCFVTTFSPITVMLLLLWKILVPFLLVGCTVRALEQLSLVNGRMVLLLNLVLSDLMGLQFFYLVTDTGSWLEIGTSISHFVIMEVTVLFLLALNLFSKFLVEYKLPFIMTAYPR